MTSMLVLAGALAGALAGVAHMLLLRSATKRIEEPGGFSTAWLAMVAAMRLPALLLAVAMGLAWGPGPAVAFLIGWLLVRTVCVALVRKAG